MAAFANGFQEDDDPLLVVPQEADSVASVSSSSPRRESTAAVKIDSNKNASAKRNAPVDTLDLTEDSPEPENGSERGKGSMQGEDRRGGARRPSYDSARVGSAAGSAFRQATHGVTNAVGQLGGVGGSSLSPSRLANGSTTTSGASVGFGQYASPAAGRSSSREARGDSVAIVSRRGSSSHDPGAGPSVNSFRQIPVISSAAAARVPSAQLPNASTSSYAAGPPSGGFMQPVSSPAAAAMLAGGTGFSSARILQATQSAFEANKPLAQRIPGPPASPAAASAAAAAIKRESSKGKGREDFVDLTADDGVSDDDEIVIDESPVCIGEIHTYGLVLDVVDEILPPPGVPPTRPDGSPWPFDELEQLQQNQRQQLKAYSHPLPVYIFRDEQTLFSGSSKEMLRLITPNTHRKFAFMDYKAANVIGPLLSNGYHGDGPHFKEGGKLACVAEIDRRGEPNPALMKLRLLLFARPFDVPGIARSLETAHPPIWLEHPVSYKSSDWDGARYQNPHNPAPGVGSRGADAERRRQALVSGVYGGSSIGAQKVAKAVDVQKQQVEEVFMNLKSGIDLDEVTPPPIVSTTLYPHQKQALSFLLDREALVEIPEKDEKGKPPAMVSLWQRKSDAYGQVRGWTNTVTDLEIAGPRPPPQARGAILADDMGLGKTIVVISLVCTTLGEAREWAKEAPSKDRLDSRLEDNAKEGRPVQASDFTTRIGGLETDNSGTTKPMSKKKQAKQRREKAKEEAVQLRFEKLVCRSRATLIVCPLSTVQNWESQFEEHTTAVDVDSQGGKSVAVDSNSAVGKALKRKMRIADSDEEEDYVVADQADEDSDDISDSSMKSDPSRKGKKKSALKIYIYHGAARCEDPKHLADHDVVITTFSTLGTEFSKQCRADEEREDEEALAAQRAAEEEDGIVEVFGFGPNGEILTSPPGQADAAKSAKAKAEKEKKAKRKRKRVEGSGVSPLQAIQWFRVVLDEAHIIKEHRTIQARAACDLSTSRRICLTGTPLQNSLNDIFSLLCFIRLEPFLDRHVWTQYVGALAQKGEPLGAERLKVIMRHLALRRTKDTKDANGKPILALPPIDNKLLHLEFSESERAFYRNHHTRYKHDFAKLEETDSVMKNFCSILQELLKLRQICVHPALLQDSQDRAAAAGEGGGDLVATIEKHGISKSRAIQLLQLILEAGGGGCLECGHQMAAFARAEGADDQVDEDAAGSSAGKAGRKPAKKARKATKLQSAPTSAATSDDDTAAATSEDDVPYIVTRCQHTFCPQCFRQHMCSTWPIVKSDDKAQCRVCQAEFQPAVDAVEVHAREYAKALAQSSEQTASKGKGKGKKATTRLFEHSTKTRHLMGDLLPFSMVNPYSANYDPTFDPAANLEKTGGTVGFQPVHGEIVKSVVFSQWTTLLDRLGDALDEQHIVYYRLDGSMNRDQRSAAMEAFKSDPRCEVLLVSLRAGGVGLNLTAGRRVYLMEPFWNPAVENQAVDRIYRLGQTKSVQTIRYVMDKTIETNMLKVQQRKKELAQMSVGRTLSKLELAKQRQQEIAILLE